MNDRVVVATLWTLAAVLLVGWLAGLVSLSLNRQDWTQEHTPQCVTQPCVKHPPRGPRL